MTNIMIALVAPLDIDAIPPHAGCACEHSVTLWCNGFADTICMKRYARILQKQVPAITAVSVNATTATGCIHEKLMPLGVLDGVARSKIFLCECSRTGTKAELKRSRVEQRRQWKLEDKQARRRGYGLLEECDERSVLHQGSEAQ